MSSVWCVRAAFGQYTDAFVKGGYVAIGWLEDQNLGGLSERKELYDLYRRAYPDDTSNVVVG